MKTKSIVLIVISLGFGCIAAVGMVQVMAKSKTDAPKIDTRPVLVALNDLDINDELNPENVKVEQWPVNMIPEGVVTQWEGNEGRRVAGRVIKGFPIQSDMLLAPGEFSGLNIRKGYKVYAIKVSGEDAFAGLLEPGNRVDVLGIFRKAGTRQNTAKTFLKNVRVFAVNDQTSRSPSKEEEGGREIRIVQLEVTELQAEKIALVEKAGSLRLVLRSEDGQFGFDDEEVEQTEESLEELLGTQEQQVASKPQPEGPGDAQAASNFDAGKIVTGLIDAWRAAQENQSSQALNSPSRLRRPHVMTMISGDGAYVFEWTDRNQPPRRSELSADRAPGLMRGSVPETRITSPGIQRRPVTSPDLGNDYSDGMTSNTDEGLEGPDDSDASGDEGHEDW